MFFDKQSPGPFHCGFSIAGGSAPLSRSYRGHFAEFLSHDSLEHLGILSPTTCVAFAVRALIRLTLEVFLGSSYRHYPIVRRRSVLSGSARDAHLTTPPIPTPFNPVFRHRAALSSLRHPFTCMCGMGILTHLPSESPFGLSLGPD